jgi:hypothetical protein
VAPRIDQPKDPWAGVWIAEDIELINQGVENGSWVDGTLGVVGASLDGLALMTDPVGVLLQYGVAWIIEHVKPLSKALDWLAGDPAQIAANAQTWRNIAGSLHDQVTDLDQAVRWDTSEWSSEAGYVYRSRAQQQQNAIGGLAKAAETMAVLTEGAGFLIAAVRILVRDAIATLVSRLIVYAAEEAGSLGLATPLVLEQVTTLIGSWAAKIARWLRSLIASLRNLIPVVRRIGELIEELKKILARLRSGTKESPLLQRVRRKGAGPIKLFNMQSVREIAAKYGIDISDLTFSFNKNIRGVCGETTKDGHIILYPAAFRSEEDLARTLAHEKFHHDELAAGKPYPTNRAEFEQWEDRAYAHEDDWWDNQPVRPEPRTK